MNIHYYPLDHDDGEKPVIESPKLGTGTVEDPTFTWPTRIECVELDSEDWISIYTGTWYIVLSVEELDLINHTLRTAIRKRWSDLLKDAENHFKNC